MSCEREINIITTKKYKCYITDSNKELLQPLNTSASLLIGNED